MSSSQSSEFQSKRQQFRNEIRRGELDDYRRRKRQEYFGYVAQGSKLSIRQKCAFMHKIPEQFKEIIAESPFSFSIEFKEFFGGDFIEKLKESKWSVETINEVLNRMVVMNIGELANADLHSQKAMFSVVSMLNKMMNAICQMPKNSIIRIEKQQLIEQIYQKIFYSLKTLINGMIAEQQHQQQALSNYEKRLNLQENILKSQSTSVLTPQKQQLLHNLTQMTQTRPSSKHPLETCIKQLSQLLEMFFNIYQHAEDAVQNGKTQTTENAIKFNRYISVLWYLMSFMRTPLFTQKLFAFFQGQLQTLNEFRCEAIDISINTLSNFLFNEPKPTPANRSSMYDPKLIQGSFGIFESYLFSYDFSPSTLITILQTMTHSIIMRKALCPLIIDSTIFSSCIQIIKDSQQKLMTLAKEHTSNRIPHTVFQKEAEKIDLRSSERYEIYHFLGALFSSISLDDTKGIGNVRKYSKDLMEIIYFEFNKIMYKEIRDKALLFAIELESAEEKERVTLSVLYLLFNLFSFSPEIIESFIENNLLMYILGIWQHFTQMEEMLSKHSHLMNNLDRIRDIKNIQYAIISAVWNILAQFWFPDQSESQEVDYYQLVDRSDALALITEFKQFGLVKMLIDYLRMVVYDTDSHSVNKETVKFALLSLVRFFKFIVYSSMEKYLCESLAKSSTQVSTVKEVLSRLMESEYVFGEHMANKALKCLELFDLITNRAGYSEVQEIFDRGYNEQPYENEHWLENQHNQQNLNQNSQDYSANWTSTQGNQSWNTNNQKDVEI